MGETLSPDWMAETLSPAWDSEGTLSPESMILATFSPFTHSNGTNGIAQQPNNYDNGIDFTFFVALMAHAFCWGVTWVLQVHFAHV
jgi:hypothetical protein